MYIYIYINIYRTMILICLSSSSSSSPNTCPTAKRVVSFRVRITSARMSQGCGLNCRACQWMTLTIRSLSTPRFAAPYYIVYIAFIAFIPNYTTSSFEPPVPHARLISIYIIDAAKPLSAARHATGALGPCLPSNNSDTHPEPTTRDAIAR